MNTVSFFNLINLSFIFGPNPETNSRGRTRAPLAQTTEQAHNTNNANNTVAQCGQAHNANSTVVQCGQAHNTNNGQADVRAQVVKANHEEIQTLLAVIGELTTEQSALRKENQDLQETNDVLKEFNTESKNLAVQAGVEFQKITDGIKQAEKRLARIQNEFAASIMAVFVFYCMIFVSTTIVEHMPSGNFSNSTVAANMSNATRYYVHCDNMTQCGLNKSILHEHATLPLVIVTSSSVDKVFNTSDKEVLHGNNVTTGFAAANFSVDKVFNTPSAKEDVSGISNLLEALAIVVAEIVGYTLGTTLYCFVTMG